jgi:hypothetical protein
MGEGLGWNEEIVSLADPHIPFNPSRSCEGVEKSVVERCCDEYVCTPLTQSTEAWKCKVEEAEEERQRNREKFRRQGEVVVDREALNFATEKPRIVEEVERVCTSVDKEEEVEVGVEAFKPLSWRERMQRLSRHRPPLKERIKDRTISYVDLFKWN